MRTTCGTGRPHGTTDGDPDERSEGTDLYRRHGLVSWHPKWAEPHWGHICRQAGLYNITLHDVRHTSPTLGEEAQQRLLQAMDNVADRQREALQPPLLHRTVRVVPYQPKQKRVVSVRTRPATVIRRLRPVVPLRSEWPG